jgi:hypothetical protein
MADAPRPGRRHAGHRPGPASEPGEILRHCAHEAFLPDPWCAHGMILFTGSGRSGTGLYSKLFATHHEYQVSRLARIIEQLPGY